MKLSRKINRPSLIGVALFGAVLALSGCSAGAPGDGQSHSAEKISFPNSKVGQSAEWVVNQLNGGKDAVDADWTSKLAPSLTAEMAPKDLVAVINKDIRPGGPYTPTDFSSGEGNAITQLLGADGKQTRFTLTIDPESGLITGIHFTPTSA